MTFRTIMHLSGVPVFAAAAVALVISATNATRAAAAENDVTVALPATATLFAPFYVAEGAGIYKKHNLNVTTRLVPGPAAANAVAAGSADFSSSSGLVLLRAAARSAPLMSIGETNNELDVRVVVTKKALAEMKVTPDSPFEDRVKALKGRTIAVDAVSGIPDGVLRYILQVGGIKREDLQVTPMQPDAMLAALQSNTIDGIAFLSPTTIQAESAGNIVLFKDPADEKSLSAITPFPFNLIITNVDTCKKRPQVCTNMIAAIKEAEALMVEQPGKALEIMKAKFPSLSAEVVEKALLKTTKATNRSLMLSDKALANAQALGLAVGFLQPSEKLDSFTKVYTNEYNK